MKIFYRVIESFFLITLSCTFYFVSCMESGVGMPTDIAQPPAQQAASTGMPPVPTPQPMAMPPQATLPAPIVPAQEGMPGATPAAAPIVPADVAQQTTPTTPAAPSTPTIEYVQPKWPEAVELVEEGKDIVKSGWQKSFLKFVEQGGKVCENIQETLLQMQKKRVALQNDFFTLDSQLDQFFQEVAVLQGKIKELMQQTSADQAVQNTTKELEEIKIQVNKIDKDESEFLNKLKQIDSKIDEVGNLVVDANKLNRQMLDITQEDAAKTSLKQLNDISNKVKDIQKQVEQEFVQGFNNAINQIKSNVLAIQEKMKKYEIDSSVFKKEIALSKDEEVEIEGVVGKEKSERIKKQKPQISESYWFDTAVGVTSFVVSIVRGVGSFFVGFFKQFMSGSKPQDSSKELAPKSVQDSEKSSQEASKKSDPVVESMKKQSQILEENIKNLDAQKAEIMEKYKKLEDAKTKRLERLQQGASSVSQTEEEKMLVRPMWRVVAQTLFDKFLDVISFVFEKVKSGITWFYDKFLKEKTSKFASAVQKKVEEIEKTDQSEQKEQGNVKLEEKVESQKTPSAPEKSAIPVIPQESSTQTPVAVTPQTGMP